MKPKRGAETEEREIGVWGLYMISRGQISGRVKNGRLLGTDLEKVMTGDLIIKIVTKIEIKIQTNLNIKISPVYSYVLTRTNTTQC